MKSSKTSAFSSPKQRFLSSDKAVAAHQVMVDSAACEIGLDVALAEFAYDLADTVTDPQAAIGAGFQLRGAVKFLKRFKELAELPKPAPAIQDTGELRPPPDKRRP